MPRTSKEKEENNELNNNKNKKIVSKRNSKQDVSKKILDNTTTKVAKSTTTKKRNTKKVTNKGSSTKKSTTKKTSTKTSSIKKTAIIEYYDLPVFYNKTIIKTLVQTPSCLFVYWEVSNEDRIKLQNQYGKNFFNDTKPFLSITNETMNYTFEVEVNDYANSWYIHINDSDCKYIVKLVRKPINNRVATYTPTVNIISSNEMDAPNDHILFDKLGKTVFFKDVKTNIVTEKDVTTISSIKNIGRIYNIYDLYKEIYKDEIFEDELNVKLSSSNFS